MNPEKNDRSNHVPPVSPENEWVDDLRDMDQLPSSQEIGLPQRRRERGIPTTKEQSNPSIRRYAPNLESRSGDKTEPTAALAAEVGSTRTAAMRATNDPTHVTSEIHSAVFAKITVEVEPTSSPATDLVANDATEVDPKEDRLARPISTLYSGHKHFRVNEINAQRIDSKREPKTLPTIHKRVRKKVFNEAFPRGGQPDGLHADTKGSTLSFMWIVGAGAGVILIVVAAILLIHPDREAGDLGKQSVFGNITPNGIHKNVGFKGGKALDFLINGEEQAKGIFATYATTKSAENLMRLVYQAEKNGEIIAGRWKPLGMNSGWKPDDNCRWTVMEEGGIKFGMLSGFLADSSGFSAVFRLEGDVIKMDWKATTGHCSADFSGLKQGLGDGAEIRAIVSPGDFHTFALSEEGYRSYRLLAPDREDNVWGYTKRNGADDVLLHSLFVPSQLTGETLVEMPVLLVLRRGSAESLPSQWMISKVVRLNWLDE